MTDISEIKLKDSLAEVSRYYVLPIELDIPASEFKCVTVGTPEWIAAPAEVFLENVEAAVTTVTIPHTSAIASVYKARLRQLTIRHRLLVEADALRGVEDIHGKKIPEDAASRNQLAHERAQNELAEEHKDPTAVRQLMSEWLGLLLDGLEDKNMETAAKELLRQAAVMVWGAFEVLCKDIFVGNLNSNPADVQKLTADSETKKIFQTKAIGLEELSEYGFDVSKNLGDVFANIHDLSSLSAIKQTFNVLFPSSQDLHDQLRGQKLWILHQRRHLIVHRRAVVDKQYLEKTGEKIQVGQQLTPTPAEIEEYIKIVCQAALALVKVAAKK